MGEDDVLREGQAGGRREEGLPAGRSDPRLTEAARRQETDYRRRRSGRVGAGRQPLDDVSIDYRLPGEWHGVIGRAASDGPP